MWISDFISCLEKSTVANPRLADALAIKEKHLPKRIYKYRSDDDFSRTNLRDDTVWICSPEAYNDPYDCLFTVAENDVMVAAKRSLVGYFAKIYKLHDILAPATIQLAEISDDPLKTLLQAIPPAHSFPEGANPRQMADFISLTIPKYVGDAMAFLRQVRDATKVCSFSKRNDSILMWSHYANYHKGFCVEYEIDPLPPDHFLRQNLYPVIYSSSLYDLTGWSTSLFSSPREQFNPSLVLLAMLHKYRDWHYEKEWRLILTEPRLTRDRPLQVPRPSRVFLG